MLDKWLEKAMSDDTGLTRPPVSARVSAHKNEVRSIDHGYYQNQFRVSVPLKLGTPHPLFIYCETPPVNYLFIVRHISQNYLIIVNSFTGDGIHDESNSRSGQKECPKCVSEKRPC